MSGGRGEEKTPTVTPRIFLLLASFVVLLDQGTKFLAQTFLVPGASFALLPNIFHLTLVENQGIAFGLFHEAEQLLFAVITVGIAALFVIGLRLPLLPLRNQWGVGLILGGALGNWLDRIRLGAVVDFLDFRIWPIFNLADTAITIGGGLFVLAFLRGRAS